VPPQTGAVAREQGVMQPHFVPSLAQVWPAGHTPPQTGAVALAHGVMQPHPVPLLAHVWPTGHTPPQAGAVALAHGVVQPQPVPLLAHVWPAGHTPPHAGAVALAQGVMQPQPVPFVEQTWPAGHGPLHIGAVSRTADTCTGPPSRRGRTCGDRAAIGIAAGSHRSPSVQLSPAGQPTVALHGDFVPLHRLVDVSVPSPQKSIPIGSVADAASPGASRKPWCEGHSCRPPGPRGRRRSGRACWRRRARTC